MWISLHLVVSNKRQSFISQILKVIGPLGEKLKWSIPLAIQIEKDLLKLHKQENQAPVFQNFKLQNLNDKNLTHD